MQPDYIQLGIAAIVSMGLIRIFEKVIMGLLSMVKKEKKDDNGKQNVEIAVMDQRLKTIETNHLPHIQAGLDKNGLDHEAMMAEIVGMNTKMNFVVEEIQKK